MSRHTRVLAPVLQRSQNITEEFFNCKLFCECFVEFLRFCSYDYLVIHWSRVHEAGCFWRAWRWRFANTLQLGHSIIRYSVRASEIRERGGGVVTAGRVADTCHNVVNPSRTGYTEQYTVCRHQRNPSASVIDDWDIVYELHYITPSVGSLQDAVRFQDRSSDSNASWFRHPPSN